MSHPQLEAPVPRWLTHMSRRHPLIRRLGLEPDEVLSELFLALHDRASASATAPRCARGSARYALLDLARRHRRTGLREVPTEPAALTPPGIGPSPELLMARRQEVRRVLAALELLPERTRRLVRLLAVDGLTQREAAGELRMAPSAVHREWARARAALAHAALRPMGPRAPRARAARPPRGSR